MFASVDRHAGQVWGHWRGGRRCRRQRQDWCGRAVEKRARSASLPSRKRRRCVPVMWALVSVMSLVAKVTPVLGEMGALGSSPKQTVRLVSHEWCSCDTGLGGVVATIKHKTVVTVIWALAGGVQLDFGFWVIRSPK